MIIEFKKISSNLTTRNLGAKLRPLIKKSIIESDKIVFDMEGVNVVSNSFADECFAKLLLDFELSEIKSKTTFKNANNFVASTIAFAFKQRLMADYEGDWRSFAA